MTTTDDRIHVLHVDDEPAFDSIAAKFPSHSDDRITVRTATTPNEGLAGLDSDGVVAIQTFEGSLNLNAIAIGLGLENIKYEPEQFPSLVYDHSDNVVVFVWPSDVIVSVAKASGDTSGVAAGIEQLVDWLHSLGLTDNIQFDDAITTHHVSNIIS